MQNKILVVIGAIILLGTGIYFFSSGTSLNAPSNSPEQQIRSVVTEFGKAIRNISLTAPKETIIQSIKEHYSPFVSEGLMEGWTSNPERAPGILSADRWPERIEILEVQARDDGAYEVQGEVIELASAEATNGVVVSKYPIALIVRNQEGRWVITGATKALSN